MKVSRTAALIKYSFRTLIRGFGSFAVLLVVGIAGAYLLTTSLLLYKCSGDVIEASSLPYSGYYITMTESTKSDILAGETVEIYSGYQIYELLRAHECVEDVVYSADDTITADISAISLDNSQQNTFPAIAVFSSELEADFRSSKNILIEGRHIARGDNDCVIISDELAELNQLSVNDKLVIGRKNTKEYKIIGIYKALKSDASVVTHLDMLSHPH